LSQRAIHKFEQDDIEPWRTTLRTIQEVWRTHGIEFEDLPGDGFRASVSASLLDCPAAVMAQQRHAARVRSDCRAIAHSPVYRA
jgi:hypothetical protein